MHELVCTLPRLGALELAFNCLRRLPDVVSKLTSLDRLTLQVRAHAPVRKAARWGGDERRGGALRATGRRIESGRLCGCACACWTQKQQGNELRALPPGLLDSTALQVTPLSRRKHRD